MESAPIPHDPVALEAAAQPPAAGFGVGESVAAFSFAGMGLMGVGFMGIGSTGVAGAGVAGAGFTESGLTGAGLAVPALQVRQSLQTDLGGTPSL